MLMRGKMAECKVVREMSSDYLDGDLQESLAARVAAHLDGCGPCRSFVNALRTTIELLRDMPKRQAPEGFSQRVLESLKAESSDKPSPSP